MAMDLAPPTTTFYDDLTAIMAHPPFRQFLKRHMTSWSDIETCVLFIKLYENLAQYTDDASAIIPVIHRIMNDTGVRRKTVECFRGFQEGRKRALEWKRLSISR